VSRGRRKILKASAFLRAALVCCGALGASACGPAQVQDEAGYDEMVFADDDAVEAAVTRPPARPVRRASAPRPLAAPAVLPPARCDNARDATSRSYGAVTSGGLEQGCRIAAQGPGYLATHKTAAYGTDETVAVLQWAAAAVAQQFPGSPPVVIGALSADGGGVLRPHRSHQSGRDVDIGYFYADRGARRFEVADASNLDAERTWALLEALIYTGDVAFVFVDYNLQALLYETLVDAGWSEAALATLLQYPAGPGVARGLLRHAAGHADHFHIRFRCAARDKPECVD